VTTSGAYVGKKIAAPLDIRELLSSGRAVAAGHACAWHRNPLLSWPQPVRRTRSPSWSRGRESSLAGTSKLIGCDPLRGMKPDAPERKKIRSSDDQKRAPMIGGTAFIC